MRRFVLLFGVAAMAVIFRIAYEQVCNTLPLWNRSPPCPRSDCCFSTRLYAGHLRMKANLTCVRASREPPHERRASS